MRLIYYVKLTWVFTQSTLLDLREFSLCHNSREIQMGEKNPRVSILISYPDCFSRDIIFENLSVLVRKHSGSPVSLHCPPRISLTSPGAQVKIRAIPAGVSLVFSTSRFLISMITHHDHQTQHKSTDHRVPQLLPQKEQSHPSSQ